MSGPSDQRAVVEYRVPAVELRVGDLVNTSPGDDDYQQVLAVYHSGNEHFGPAPDANVKRLVESLAGRYVVVQLTDLVPIDGGVYFAAGQAMVGAGEDSDDPSVADVASSDDGVRTYLYTRFELVTVRGARGGG
jgi:hypothetical protein